MHRAFWSRLVVERLLSAEESESAQARHDAAGGAPDTAILETHPLSAADRQRMLRVLSRLLDTPVAPPVYLEQPEDEALALVPRAFALEHAVLGVHGRGNSLSVVAPPLPPHVLSDLSRQTARRVEQYLAFEFDVRAALERHLDEPPGERFAALAEALDAAQPTLAAPADVDVDSGWGPRQTGPLLSATRLDGTAPLAPRVADDPYDRAVHRLRRAHSPTEVRDAVDAVGRRGLAGLRVFLWRDGEALRGLGGSVPGLPKTRIRELEMEVDTRTVLGKAATLGLEHAGPASDPSLKALYAALDRAPPSQALVEPVRDGPTVVGVFVGDHGDQPLPEGAVSGMRRVLAVCGLPLRRLAMVEVSARASIDGSWDEDLDTVGTPAAVTATLAPAVDAEDVYDADWDSELGGDALEGPTRPMSADLLRQLAREAVARGAPVLEEATPFDDDHLAVGAAASSEAAGEPAEHDEADHDEADHDEADHDEPDHDEPDHDEAEHDEPDHDEPDHDEAEHEPEHDEPEHGGAPQDEEAAATPMATDEAVADPPGVDDSEVALDDEDEHGSVTLSEDIGVASTLGFRMIDPIYAATATIEGAPDADADGPEIDPMGTTADLSLASAEAKQEILRSLPRFKSLAARESVLSTHPEARVVDVTPGPETIKPVTFKPASAASEPAPIPDTNEIRDAVARLSDPGARDAAISLLLRAGGGAVDALSAAFPGQLVVDRYAQAPGEVPIGDHSGVLAAMVRFGPRAVPALEELSEHLSPEIRYYAVLCFDSVRSAPTLPRLAGRLFDSDPTVRDAAIHVLDGYRHDPDFSDVVMVLRRALASDRSSTRRVAAEMAGRLHAVETVPDLAALLGAPQPPVVDTAHRALIEIARQDFGFEGWMWTRWHERNAGRPRVEWLIEALVSDRRPQRAGAFRELQTLTGLDHGYHVDAPPPDRKAAADRWDAWWAEDGRRTYSGR